MSVAGTEEATSHRQMRRPWALLLAGAVAFLSGFGSGEAQSENGRIVEEYPPVEVAALPSPRPERPTGTESLEAPELVVVTKGELRPGQPLGAALQSHGVPASVVHVIDRKMKSVFDFRHSQPGDRYRLSQSADGAILTFRYATGPEKIYRLAREEDGFRVWSETRELHSRHARLAGVIESSLYEAVRSLGEQPQLANDFADLFAWDVDFSRGVQPGDDFQVLYERLYRIDEDGHEDYVRPGRILAARYRNEAGQFSAVWFEDPDGGGRYYRDDGTSLERAFLVAPMQYTRISSRFTSARRHPILKITRPHYGIDYAAPEGTPIWAVADGTVIYRGWGGSFGNLIKIRHNNGYVSYYSHLQGFEKGLKVGQRVKQKQIIGRVGQTGLATGPHVCFRVARNGRYVDPMSIRSPAGKSVSDELWLDFQIVRDALIGELEGETLATTQEAL
jgi:murein DD-endopeptidase MepM/ murein hydrolase activator NlpD